MEDLRLVIFVLGTLGILAVLVHGFLSIRKQQGNNIRSKPRVPYTVTPGRRDSEGFDADGIGEVRIKRRAPDMAADFVEGSAAVAQPKAQDDGDFSLEDGPKVKRVRDRHEPVMHRPAATSRESQVQLGLLDELPEDQQDYDDYPQQDEPHYAQAAAPAPVAAPQRQPVPPQPPEPVKEEPLPEPRDVLVLHVVAREGRVLAGAELLPSLLELNFKFGEMEIFHRHEDNAGTGKVLFSLANMIKPGVFDPDAMEQFNTHGVVMFMTLPCHGEAVRNFSIMLNSACQLADDLDALVLDGQRQLWSEATKTDYLNRIRQNA